MSNQKNAPVESEDEASKATTRHRLSRLEAIPHSPATDEELNGYASGIVTGVMKYPTPNCVASILARVRQDNSMIEDGQRRIEALTEVVKEVVEALKKVMTTHCPNDKIFCSACSSAREAISAYDALKGKR